VLRKRPVKTVLLIESDPQEVRKIGEMFNDQGSYSFELVQSESLVDAEAYVEVHPVNVILVDLALFDASGVDRLLRTNLARHASVVLLCDPKDEAVAVRALEEGVQDYLFKNQVEPHELMRAMRNSVARKILEEALFNERNRAQVTLECIGDAIICTDDSGNITFLNRVAETMTGWPLKEARGQPLARAFRIMDASTGEIAADPTLRAIGRGRTSHLPLNCILTRRDGHQLFIEDSVAPIRDHDGQTAGSVLVFRDITRTRALAEQIAHLAEHDSLTGLPNRLLLNDRLNHAIAAASRNAGLMAVLFLDLDGFKHINDSLGHSTGDKLLQSVAERLQHCVRTPDTVSRQGGDEFVVLLTDIRHAEDAAVTARRILKSVMEPQIVESSELHVTASIGISIYPNDGVNAETLLKNADAAMYQAKESGRHSYRFFTPEMNIRAVERQSLEQDLRRAFKRKELTLEYQPILSLKSGTIIGAEALLRWTHPTRGPVAPSVFIPVAEESGLIMPIGAWVMHEACTQARAWTKAGLRSITMSVNVSAHQFRSESFLASITRTLEETGISPRSLNIEVTESALMERAKLGAPILTALRANGVQVSIDDFGTGYSSLSYLQKLPVDALKIDQSFVRQISPAAEDTTIVSAIIGMGRTLKLKVIAEGVEVEHEVEFLKAQNCDEAQGFFFGRPMPAEKFARLDNMQVN
jgi:diguanylate cyclase (GGDEF)-like protein/PAS domain S-box-containing protein